MNKIFNVYQNQATCRTELTILGIKFKFLNKKLVVRPDYSKALDKIKEKYRAKEKIRVAFLVSENSKWNSDELYDLLEKSDVYEPFILVTLLTYVHFGNDKTRNNLDENYNFFKQQGKRVFYAYNQQEKRYIDLNEFSPDIVFYQQPWGIAENQEINNVSDNALCCNFHYGLNLFESDVENLPFYKKLFLYFIPNEQIKEFFKPFGYENLKVVGFPKLDVYKKLKINTAETKTVIYAPHFSYSPKSILKIGTFDKTGEKILEFAKKHNEYNWIFKPHPVLKNELTNDKKFGAKYVEKYYSEWAKIGKVYEQGEYFDLFNSSDLLITDCSAFLLEYMPTLRPIIRLENLKSTKLNKFGELIVSGTYRVNSFNEFETCFKSLLIDKKDELLAKRKEIVSMVLTEESSSQRILNVLDKLFSE